MLSRRVPGAGRAEPGLAEERDIVLWHQDETLRLYGAALGNKTFRKHLGWTLARLELRGLLDGEAHATLRATLSRAVTTRFSVRVSARPMPASLMKRAAA